MNLVKGVIPVGKWGTLLANAVSKMVKGATEADLDHAHMIGIESIDVETEVVAMKMITPQNIKKKEDTDQDPEMKGERRKLKNINIDIDLLPDPNRDYLVDC